MGPNLARLGRRADRPRLLAGALGMLGVALLLAGLWLAAATTFGAGAIACAAIGAVLATMAVFWFRQGSVHPDWHHGIQRPRHPTRRRGVRGQIKEADEQLTRNTIRVIQADADTLGLEALNSDTLLEVEEALDAADARDSGNGGNSKPRLTHATERAEAPHAAAG